MAGGFRTPTQLLRDAVHGAPGRYGPPQVVDLVAGTAALLLWGNQGKSAIKIKLRNLGTVPVKYLINGDLVVEPPQSQGAGDAVVDPPDPLLPHDPNAVPVPKCSAAYFHDSLGAGLAADDGMGAQVAFDDTEIKTLSVFAADPGGRVGVIVVLASDAF